MAAQARAPTMAGDAREKSDDERTFSAPEPLVILSRRRDRSAGGGHRLILRRASARFIQRLTTSWVRSLVLLAERLSRHHDYGYGAFSLPALSQRATDTPDKLDYDRFTVVLSGMQKVIEELASH